MKELSIIIVSYNTVTLIKDCLNSIRELRQSNDCEVIVVDNDSRDGTQEMLEKNFKGVSVLLNKHNVGFGKANNQGMGISLGKYVLLLNSDTIAESGEIRKCMQYLDENPDIGVLGCRLVDAEGRLQASCGKFFTLFNAMFGSIELNKVLKFFFRSRVYFWEHLLTAHDHQLIQDVDWVSGAFMLIRREVLNATGGFDEKIFLYGEEHEWCYRIKKAGWKIAYYPKAVITHIGHGSGKAFRQLKRNQYILSGKLYFFKKHHGLVIAKIFKNLLFAGALFKSIVWSLVYALSLKNKYFKGKVLYQLAIIQWYFFGALKNES